MIDEAVLTKIQLQFRKQQGLEIFLDLLRPGPALGTVRLYGLFVW